MSGDGMSGAGMATLLARAQAAANARADALRESVKARLARALPGVAQRVEEDRIILTGRNLVRRWIGSEALQDWRGDGS